ncbi:MAG: hypothetical protein R3C56_08185 [Pirellulaceae bacterium]
MAAPLQPLVFRNAGEGRREVLLRGPGDSLIVVGRDVSRVMHRLNESLVQLIAIGAVSLGLIGGGGWRENHSANHQISDTAERITAEPFGASIPQDGQRIAIAGWNLGIRCSSGSKHPERQNSSPPMLPMNCTFTDLCPLIAL